MKEPNTTAGPSPMAPSVVIDVWSDYVCPFCWLEAPVLDRVRARFGDAVDVVWHAFELRPDPVPTLDPAGEYLRSTWARAVHPMQGDCMKRSPEMWYRGQRKNWLFPRSLPDMTFTPSKIRRFAQKRGRPSHS